MLTREKAFEQHKLICGVHKPILPVMPISGSVLKFESWGKTQRHPFVLYADFETLLVKSNEIKGDRTRAFQSHVPMSYAILVKPADCIPVDLMQQFDIPQNPIVFRGSDESDCTVARHFVLSVAEIARRISILLRTYNAPIVMSEKQHHVHGEKTVCDFCLSAFTEGNCKVADHDHLTGAFRQTLCNTCNLAVKSPKFVPCFLHNLSRYDGHFIVTELGYDTNTISVIPNSEENYISFSKYIDNKFSVRFIDTCRFMSTSLASLA